MVLMKREYSEFFNDESIFNRNIFYGMHSDICVIEKLLII